MKILKLNKNFLLLNSEMFFHSNYIFSGLIRCLNSNFLFRSCQNENYLYSPIRSDSSNLLIIFTRFPKSELSEGLFCSNISSSFLRYTEVKESDCKHTCVCKERKLNFCQSNSLRKNIVPPEFAAPLSIRSKFRCKLANILTIDG